MVDARNGGGLGQALRWGNPLDIERAFERVEQLRFDHRLADERLHLILLQPLRLVLEHVGGDDENRQMSVPVSAQVARGFPAVEIVHVDVHEHGGWRELAQQLKALGAAGRLANIEAQWQQQRREHLPLHRLIIHQQQRVPRTDIAADRAVALGLGDGRGDLRQMHAHRELAAAGR